MKKKEGKKEEDKKEEGKKNETAEKQEINKPSYCKDYWKIGKLEKKKLFTSFP